MTAAQDVVYKVHKGNNFSFWSVCDRFAWALFFIFF